MSDTALYRAAEYFDDQIINPLRTGVTGRKLIEVSPLPETVYTVVVNTLTDLNGAQIAYALPSGAEANRDNVKISKANKDLLHVFKDFEVPRADFEAFSNQNIAMDTLAAQSAAYVVGQKEDALILDGWKPDGTAYQVSGLYQSAGNDYSSSSNFGSAGVPTTCISGALALIEADNALADAYNLILNPVQAAKLRGLRSTYGVLEQPEILQLLNGGGTGPGRIYSTTAQTAGTGMLSPVDPTKKFMELYEAVGVRTELGYDSAKPQTGPIFGRIYERVYPHIKYANALCKLSALV
jgi:uncharacterized linocin/CFP29 family protein